MTGESVCIGRPVIAIEHGEEFATEEKTMVVR